MVAKTLTISMPEQLLKFLNENPAISPSKVFQSALLSIQENIKHNPQLIQAIKDNNQLKKVIDRMQTDIQTATEFITIKGYWEEFVKNHD